MGMDYTEEMMKCLSKMSEEQLEELQKMWKNKYNGDKVLNYLKWVLDKTIAKKMQ